MTLYTSQQLVKHRYKGKTNGKLSNGLGLLSYLHVSNLETGPACGILSLNQNTCPLLLLARPA